MSVVYRVEHRDTRQGPYTSRSEFAYNHLDDFQDKHHPVPIDDGILIPWAYKKDDPERECWRHGFSSMDQLRAWFRNHHLVELDREDYLLRLYSVPDTFVLRGQKQVIYRAAKAVEVDEMRLTAI